MENLVNNYHTEEECLAVLGVLRDLKRAEMGFEDLRDCHSLAHSSITCHSCQHKIKPQMVEFCGLGGFRVNYRCTCKHHRLNPEVKCIDFEFSKQVKIPGFSWG